MARKRLVPGATALWLCNEGAGTTLIDTSGNGYNGTFGAAGAAPAWGPNGIILDGGDVVTLPGLNAALAGRTGLTVICAAKSTGTATENSGLIGLANPDSWENRTFILLPASSAGARGLSFTVSSGSAVANATATGALSSSAYECVVGRFIGGASVQVCRWGSAWTTNTTSIPAAINATPGNTQSIGIQSATYFTGGFAFGAIYPFALTDGQIAQVYAYLKALKPALGLA